MSRTIYDAVREANWLRITKAGFGATTTIHVHHDTRSQRHARSLELPYDASLIEIWEHAQRLYRECIKEARDVVRVTKELMQ